MTKKIDPVEANHCQTRLEKLNMQASEIGVKIEALKAEQLELSIEASIVTMKSSGLVGEIQQLVAKATITDAEQEISLPELSPDDPVKNSFTGTFCDAFIPDENFDLEAEAISKVELRIADLTFESLTLEEENKRLKNVIFEAKRSIQLIASGLKQILAKVTGEYKSDLEKEEDQNETRASEFDTDFDTFWP